MRSKKKSKITSSRRFGWNANIAMFVLLSFPVGRVRRGEKRNESTMTRVCSYDERWKTIYKQFLYFLVVCQNLFRIPVQLQYKGFRMEDNNAPLCLGQIIFFLTLLHWYRLSLVPIYPKLLLFFLILKFEWIMICPLCVLIDSTVVFCMIWKLSIRFLSGDFIAL